MYRLHYIVSSSHVGKILYVYVSVSVLQFPMSKSHDMALRAVFLAISQSFELLGGGWHQASVRASVEPPVGNP